MSTASQQLDLVPEDWKRALAVVAHPDDLEYGAAAAIARWTGQGKQIAYCLATSGEAGIDSMPPEQAGPVREAEQRAAAAVVGVSDVEFLGLPDGILEYGLPLRRAITAAIRRHRPEIVIGLSHREDFHGWPTQPSRPRRRRASGHRRSTRRRQPLGVPRPARRRPAAVARRAHGAHGRVTTPHPRRRCHRDLRPRAGVAARAPRLPRGPRCQRNRLDRIPWRSWPARQASDSV